MFIYNDVILKHLCVSCNYSFQKGGCYGKEIKEEKKKKKKTRTKLWIEKKNKNNEHVKKK